ncbi:apolipoprotein L3-like [Colossoma macropomum]|uniref:apolipoprotein L3-like n=1 Tax=Colossoma macropomum TaxID=42526 RepID=UPI001863CDBE|nr:apolipoprotein L3-like [Colossoma macropomum]
MACSNEYRRIDCEGDCYSINSTGSNRSMDQPASTEQCVPPDKSLIAKIQLFTSLFDSNVSDLKALIKKLTGITDNLEKTHRSATIGSLSGGVIGAAGGITSIVGVILAPFTLGASLIVTGVGIGVAVAGGITGAASNITDMVRQRTLRGEIEEILKTFQSRISPIIECLEDIKLLLEEIQKIELSESSAQKMQSIFGVARGAGHAAELIRLVNVAEIGRVAAQVSRTVRAAAAMTGVISGLFLLFDIAFIFKDTRELIEIDKERKDGSERSDVVKFIQEMRKTADHLKQTLKELKKHKERLNAEITDKLKAT